MVTNSGRVPNLLSLRDNREEDGIVIVTFKRWLGMFACVFFMPGAAVHIFLFGNFSWPSFLKMAVVNEELAPVSVGRVCNFWLDPFAVWCIDRLCLINGNLRWERLLKVNCPLSLLVIDHFGLVATCWPTFQHRCLPILSSSYATFIWVEHFMKT